jgi:hypothetical protein
MPLFFAPLRPGRRSPAAAEGEMGRPARRSLRAYGTKEEVCFA